MKNKIAWLIMSCLMALSLLLVSCDFISGGSTTTITTTVTVTTTATITTTTTSTTATSTTTAPTPTTTVPTGQITNAAISWGTSPDQIIFTWAVSNLNPSFEYWVYPHVGFTENSGPFGSTPQDEANSLEGMYDMAITHFRPATDGTGAWNWYGGKPTNPTGSLALLAYDPVTHQAYVVAISAPIDISAW